MKKNIRSLMSIFICLSLLSFITPSVSAVNNDRTEAADNIIWSASEADITKVKGDALDADGNLTIGWTPDKHGSTYANINNAVFTYYLSHTSENGSWSSSEKGAVGPSLKFTAPEDGVFTAYVVNLNTVKTFYIAEGGGSSPIYLEQTTGEESGWACSLSVNVEAGKVYYAYVKGSKGSFCGAAFEPGEKIVPPVNLINNNGFEDGVLEPFENRSASCSVSDIAPHSGSYCALVSGRTQDWTGIQYDITSLTPDLSGFEVSAWIKLADTAPDVDSNFYLQVELKEPGYDPEYPIVASVTAKKNEWLQVSGTFSLESYSKPLEKAYIYICSADGNTVDFYVDDFELYSAVVSESQYGPITEFPTTPIDTTESEAAIDFNILHQKIEGFGGSGAFGSAQTIRNLPSDKQDEVLTLLFDETDGIGLEIIRNMLTPDVGSVPGSIDLDTPMNETCQGWLMEQGRKYGVDKIMTTCWSPPAWMKDNGSVIGGSLSTDHYLDFAKYLADYIEAYAEKGITIDVISPANEPDYSPDYYEGCTWTPQQIADFMKNYLKPELLSRGLDTSTMAAEEMSFGENWLSGLIYDQDAMNATDIIGCHGYANSQYNHLTNIENANKQVWLTEIMGYYSKDDTILDGLLWAKRIHQAVAQAGASAWNFWYLANRYDGGNSALIVVDKAQQDYAVTKRLYTIGNYSRYIRPGARRVESTLIPNSDVYLSAYKNVDGRLVIVAANGNVNDQTVHTSLSGCNAESFTAYRTSASEDLAYAGISSVENGMISLELPAMSVTTYITEPDGAGTLFDHMFTDNSELKLYEPYISDTDGKFTLKDGTMLGEFNESWSDNNGIKIDITSYVKENSGNIFTASLDYLRDNYYDSPASLFFDIVENDGETTRIELDSKTGENGVITNYSGSASLSYENGSSIYLCMTHPTGYQQFDNISLSCYEPEPVEEIFSVDSYENGTAHISATVPRAAAVVFAEYDDKGILIKSDIQEITLSTGDNAISSDVITSDQNVKILLLNGLSDMKPLCACAKTN